LFGAKTTAVLQRALGTLYEHQRRKQHDVAHRLRGCLYGPELEPVPPLERAAAEQLVEAVVALLQSGPHNAVWAQASVEQKPLIAWFVEEHCKVMTLAIGDGVNDVEMVRTSHVSVGIRGSESQLAAQAASFCADEWKQLRPLLLTHAVRTMVLLSTTMKWVYYKHAMTACALEAWMVHGGYNSWLDPTDPVYAMFFNGTVFLNVISYAVEDLVEAPELVRRKNLFSLSSLVRWWLTGAVHGFMITFAIVLCFEEQTPKEAGIRIFCLQTVVLSARLAFITNNWLSWSDVLQLCSDELPATSVTTSADADAEADGGSARDKPAAVTGRLLLTWALRALHTKAGHFVPSMLFTLGATTWTGVETVPIVLLAVVVSALCLASDCLVFPRYGPVRYAMEMVLQLPARLFGRRQDSKVKAT